MHFLTTSGVDCNLLGVNFVYFCLVLQEQLHQSLRRYKLLGDEVVHVLIVVYLVFMLWACGLPNMNVAFLGVSKSIKAGMYYR
jgi:cellobiose-specific phosphotransferase system component IIC